MKIIIYSDNHFCEKFSIINKMGDKSTTRLENKIEAITQADTREQYAGDIHDILRSYQLVTLTKMADLAAQYLD